MLILSAILSWPISTFITNQSMRQLFWMSGLMVLVCCCGMFLFENTWIVMTSALIYTVAFTSMSVSSLPLAIQRAGHLDKVLCVGIFFSGVALPEGLIETLMAL